MTRVENTNQEATIMNVNKCKRVSFLTRQIAVSEESMVYKMEQAVAADPWRNVQRGKIKVIKTAQQPAVAEIVAMSAPVSDSQRLPKLNTSLLSYHHDGSITCVPANWNSQSGFRGRRNRQYR